MKMFTICLIRQWRQSKKFYIYEDTVSNIKSPFRSTTIWQTFVSFCIILMIINYFILYFTIAQIVPPIKLSPIFVIMIYSAHDQNMTIGKFKIQNSKVCENIS